MKTPGTGTVTPREDVHGRIRFWARAPDRKRTSLGVHDTEEQAERAIEAWRSVRRARGASVHGDTFAEFGAKVMEARELDGIRGIRQELTRWRNHLAVGSLASKDIAEIEAADVQTWVRELGRKKITQGAHKGQKTDRETVRRCLSLASRVFDESIIAGRRADNPALRIKVKGEPKTEEPWDYLRPEEQLQIWTSENVPEWGRLMQGFAWGTGLRQGEQWNLELRDLHVDGEDPHLIVRFGSAGQAPKNGRIRRVELFGIGLEAARRWLALLPKYCKRNPLGLVFPTVTGCRRPLGAPARSVRDASKRKVVKEYYLPIWLRAAGVAREVRWHDLRHTCASSLVAGWWGRTWTLQEVCSMLGHSSITVTQRYAHLGETSLKRAARETSNGLGKASSADDRVAPGNGHEPPRVDREQDPTVPSGGAVRGLPGVPGAPGVALEARELGGYDLGTLLKLLASIPPEIRNLIK